MRKLKISLDDLRVESFATGSRPPRPGTVVAHGPDDPVGPTTEKVTEPETAVGYTCYSCELESCGGSCPGGHTCQESCVADCDVYTGPVGPDI